MEAISLTATYERDSDNGSLTDVELVAESSSFRMRYAVSLYESTASDWAALVHAIETRTQHKLVLNMVDGSTAITIAAGDAGCVTFELSKFGSDHSSAIVVSLRLDDCSAVFRQVADALLTHSAARSLSPAHDALSD
jgi:hypothetical protein